MRRVSLAALTHGQGASDARRWIPAEEATDQESSRKRLTVALNREGSRAHSFFHGLSQVVRNQPELRQRRLQVFDNLPRNHARWGQVVAVGQ